MGWCPSLRPSSLLSRRLNLQIWWLPKLLSIIIYVIILPNRLAIHRDLWNGIGANCTGTLQSVLTFSNLVVFVNLFSCVRISHLTLSIEDRSQALFLLLSVSTLRCRWMGLRHYNWRIYFFLFLRRKHLRDWVINYLIVWLLKISEISLLCTVVQGWIHDVDLIWLCASWLWIEKLNIVHFFFDAVAQQVIEACINLGGIHFCCLYATQVRISCSDPLYISTLLTASYSFLNSWFYYLFTCLHSLWNPYTCTMIDLEISPVWRHFTICVEVLKVSILINPVLLWIFSLLNRLVCPSTLVVRWRTLD